MAPTVVPGSVGIKILNHPQVQKPIIPFTGGPLNKGRAPKPVFAGFTCSSGISLVGDVVLSGDETEINACAVGFMQMQWVETGWFYYRGKVNSHGSLLVQTARPPARSQQVCRDCLNPDSSRFWVDVEANGVPSKISDNKFAFKCFLDDAPFQAALLLESNSLTGQLNLLQSAQIERNFCTICTLQDNDGNLHHLASRYWNVHWQATFQPTAFDEPFTKPWRIYPIAKGSTAAVGGLILGPPSDKRFASLIGDPTTPMCNDLLRQSGDVVDDYNPDLTINVSFDKRTRRESRVWHQFDVRI